MQRGRDKLDDLSGYSKRIFKYKSKMYTYPHGERRATVASEKKYYNVIRMVSFQSP